MPHWPWSSRRPVSEAATVTAPARPESSATVAPAANAARGTRRPQRKTNASASAVESRPRAALPSCATTMSPPNPAVASGGAGCPGTPSSPRAAMIVLPTAYSRLNKAATTPAHFVAVIRRKLGTRESASGRDREPHVDT